MNTHPAALPPTGAAQVDTTAYRASRKMFA